MGLQWYTRCQATDHTAVVVLHLELTRKYLVPPVRILWLLFPVIFFRTLGTPNNDVWPEVESLPDYKNTFPKWKSGNLASMVKNLDTNGLDLLAVRAAVPTNPVYYCPALNGGTADALLSDQKWFLDLAPGLFYTFVFIMKSKQLYWWMGEVGLNQERGRNGVCVCARALWPSQRVNTQTVFFSAVENVDLQSSQENLCARGHDSPVLWWPG